MQVKLKYFTPLQIAIDAIRNCWESGAKGDAGGPKDMDLIRRIIHKNKHESTIEHLHYNFEIDGISRGCLQELARHRIASYSVKSTRYTLKELLKAESFDDFMGFLVSSGNNQIDDLNVQRLRIMQELKEKGVPNDTLKYLLPEAYKTHLHFSINARSLRNFLKLRLSMSAHPEIRKLAEMIGERIPDSHFIIYEDLLPAKIPENTQTTQDISIEKDCNICETSKNVNISEYRGREGF